jgi:hypothetical protein
MKKNLIILFLVFLTIINVAALATIAYHRFHPKRPFSSEGPPDVHRNFIQQELGLNGSQKGDGTDTGFPRGHKEEVDGRIIGG